MNDVVRVNKVFEKGKICMKKGFCKITVLLVMLFALTACGAQPLPEQFEEDTVREAAEQAIRYFNEKDYQSIIEMGNDDFQRVLTEEEFLTILNDPKERDKVKIGFKWF